MIPSPFTFALLALAAFRVFHLIAEDTILDRPLRRVREYEAVTCPFCAGFWIALAWWGAWLISPHWATLVAVPFSLSAVVAAIAVALNSLTD